MPIDIEKYRHYLKGKDLTSAQEEQLLRAVAVILEGCVDYVFMTHPAQQGRKTTYKTDCQIPDKSLESIRKSIRDKYLQAANDSHYEVEDEQKAQ